MHSHGRAAPPSRECEHHTLECDCTRKLCTATRIRDDDHRCAIAEGSHLLHQSRKVSRRRANGETQNAVNNSAQRCRYGVNVLLTDVCAVLVCPSPFALL
jgi:hypothetical protein